MNKLSRQFLLISILTVSIGATHFYAQEFVSLRPDVGVQVTLGPNQEKSLTFDAAADQYCEITSSATDEQPMTMSVIDPSGETLIKDGDGTEGIVFIAPSTGKYR